MCFSAHPSRTGGITIDAPTLTRKEAIWLACKQKTCCYSTFVLPSGRDIWRISRTLDTPPWAFLVYFEQPAPRPDAFVLDKSGRAFRLALAKQPSRRKKSLPPCIFLLKTNNGHHRCGLGELRPQVCHSFPFDMVGGVVCVAAEPGCTCRQWSVSDVGLMEETAENQAREAGYQEYCAVVEEWNRQVAAAPDDAVPTFFDYCNFLLEAYDWIAEHEAGSVAVAAGGEL